MRSCTCAWPVPAAALPPHACPRPLSTLHTLGIMVLALSVSLESIDCEQSKDRARA